MCPFVAQSLIYGDSLKNCCVAIIVPDPDRAKSFAKENGLTEAEVMDHASFKAALLKELDTLGKANNLSSLERPKDIFIQKEPFSVENDILTPTFKLKRNIGKATFQTQIDVMYAALAEKGM